MNVSLNAPPPQGRCETRISAAAGSGDNNNTEAR
jgi:hypothetical protein